MRIIQRTCTVLCTLSITGQVLFTCVDTSRTPCAGVVFRVKMRIGHVCFPLTRISIAIVRRQIVVVRMSSLHRTCVALLVQSALVAHLRLVLTECVRIISWINERIDRSRPSGISGSHSCLCLNSSRWDFDFTITFIICN